jgi:hypothetical protein
VTSFPRSHEPPDSKVSDPNGGAAAAPDLGRPGRLFVEWAIRERLFSRISDWEALTLSRAFLEGYEAGNRDAINSAQ